MPDEVQKAPETPAPAAAEAPQQRHSEIDLLTLVITAVASATAAYICSRVWQAGTLPSAAAMPVVVALVKEGLRRPTEAVVPTARGRMKVVPRPVHHHWRSAAITGVAGFALFAFLATTTELLSGRSVAGSDSKTTLFGGTRTVVVKQSTVTVRTVAPEVTTVVVPSQTATETVTAPAPAEAVPTTPTSPAPAPEPNSETPSAP